MKLTEAECTLFFNLYHPLLLFINQQYQIIADVFTLDGLRKKSSEHLKSLRTVLINQPSLFDLFISTNPFHFLPHELEMINSWKKWLVGRFFIFRETNYYTVFLSNIRPIRAYAVMALNAQFSKIFAEPLPVYVETALLPFKDKIITDGIFSRFRLEFGGGFIRNLQKSYLEAIDNEGIITSL
jgi:hypothetical protein